MKRPFRLPTYEETLKDDCHGDRIRKTLTVQQRAAAFEHTNRIATDVADEERRLRKEKNERLRKLRLAAANTSRTKPLPHLVRKGSVTRSTSEYSMGQIDIETSVGARLREARTLKNYSLEDLALATGLTEAEITAVEDGSSHDAHHVERIEHALR